MLVDVTELRGAVQHGVGRELRLGGPAKFFVQFAEQLVLAGGRDDEVAGGEDQVLGAPAVPAVQERTLRLLPLLWSLP